MKTVKVVKSKESRLHMIDKSNIKTKLKKPIKALDRTKFRKGELARIKDILGLSAKSSKMHPVKLPDGWKLFSENLADALAKLKNKQYLILTVDDTNRFVQFATLKGGGIRAETTSNQYLTKENQLNERQIITLARMGWEVPTKTLETLSENNEPGGSPNFFVDFSGQTPYEIISTLAVRTFAEVFGVQDPASLIYDAFKRKSQLIDLPELGIARREAQEMPVQDITTMLLETLKEVTGLRDIESDKDGDIGISCGSAVTYIRPIDDGKAIHMFSPLVCEVIKNTEIMERIKVMNANTTDMQFTFVSGAVYAEVDVPARPYDGTKIAKVFEQFSQIADSMGALLKEEFGGKTWIVKSLPSVMRH